MRKLVVLLLLAFALDSFGQAVTSPPPANVMFVPNPYGYYLSKHPALPVLYVGGYYAPESKNLITYPLNTDGTVNTNGVRSFNFFTRTGTNDRERYSLARPLVLPDERILYLGAIASAATYYTSDTNNQEVAAVSLDDTGQPVQVLKAIRTSHSEKEIRGWEFDPSTRRLYLSYHTYFGWLPINAEGLPESDKFNLILYIQTCWQWAYRPEWKRFYARQTDSGVMVFKLVPDGTALEVVQFLGGPYRGVGNLTVHPGLRRLYFLDTLGGRLVIHRLARDGRITGLPRFVPLGEAYGVRFDFKTKSLYAWYDKALLRRFALDDHGDPLPNPQLHALHCGAIRDMLVDEPSGKLYVLCTEPPQTKP